LQAPNVLDQIE